MSEVQLIEALENYPKFQELPLDERDVLTRMAQAFTEDEQNLYFNPTELTLSTRIGNAHKWGRFLSLEPVQAYVDRQMAEAVKIGSRKGIGAAIRNAQAGDQQLIRQLNDLAGIFAKRDSNKVVVLHKIERPE